MIDLDASDYIFAYAVCCALAIGGVFFASIYDGFVAPIGFGILHGLVWSLLSSKMLLRVSQALPLFYQAVWALCTAGVLMVGFDLLGDRFFLFFLASCIAQVLSVVAGKAIRKSIQ